MRIIKASAGSGKTYRLSHTYIYYLLNSGDPFAYRHLLAVTFTNKATAEMKERILRDLAAYPATSAAHKYLIRILHDYGAFGVSTIDRFFQQTLRAFARELGQFSAYQIELDKASLVSEAVDRMLDSVSAENKELKEWLRRNAMEQISSGGRFSLDDGLDKMGARLKSDEYRRIRKQYGINEAECFAKDRLEAIHKACTQIIKDFEKDAAALGVKAKKNGHYDWPSSKKALDAPGVEELFTGRFDSYSTALIVDGQLFGLGVAREFIAGFDALLKEKNVLPLDESNTLLRDIIDGSDAPFVYEKTGSRYSHYLLDEFQDTSRMQWDNFLPLLLDAEGSGENLIVGDVKQSIYRWRDSDWRLLGGEVEAAFPGSHVEEPEDNWRSARAIVSFNSDFFRYAAQTVGLSDLYSNVKQTPKTKEEQEGFVRLSFTQDQIQMVTDSIRDVYARGARLSDIAVLVRDNKTGASIADSLIKEGIAVVSDDSFDLKCSVTARRLISLLTFYDNPSNTVGSYLARATGVEFPKEYHSLIDFCEHLLRGLKVYDPATFEAETVFVSAFMDRLQEWTAVNGNDIKAFIRTWNEKKEIFIGTPGESDAVRIMTVHKAKGLEFPHVIFPFADHVLLSKDDIRWCYLDGGGSPLGHIADGIYPVRLSGTSVHTLFAGAYEEERKMQTVDNLNVFYVALTRASKSLHIIAKEPAADKVRSLKAGKTIKWSNYSEMLFAWCGCCSDRTWGTPYDFTRMERKAADGQEPLKAAWVSVPPGDRLRASEDASDYFGPDGLTGTLASGRLRGIELHRALSAADGPDSLPRTLEPADREMLGERMLAHPEWFGEATGRNELTVFAQDGSRHRPDRVIMAPDGGVTVIDYKFGAERDSYIWQVRRYVNLYRKMGYAPVKGYVWYVPEDKTVQV